MEKENHTNCTSAASCSKGKVNEQEQEVKTYGEGKSLECGNNQTVQQIEATTSSEKANKDVEDFPILGQGLPRGEQDLTEHVASRNRGFFFVKQQLKPMNRGAAFTRKLAQKDEAREGEGSMSTENQHKDETMPFLHEDATNGEPREEETGTTENEREGGTTEKEHQRPDSDANEDYEGALNSREQSFRQGTEESSIDHITSDPPSSHSSFPQNVINENTRETQQDTQLSGTTQDGTQPEQLPPARDVAAIGNAFLVEMEDGSENYTKVKAFVPKEEQMATDLQNYLDANPQSITHSETTPLGQEDDKKSKAFVEERIFRHLQQLENFNKMCVAVVGDAIPPTGDAVAHPQLLQPNDGTPNQTGCPQQNVLQPQTEQQIPHQPQANALQEQPGSSDTQSQVIEQAQDETQGTQQHHIFPGQNPEYEFDSNDNICSPASSVADTDGAFQDLAQFGTPPSPSHAACNSSSEQPLLDSSETCPQQVYQAFQAQTLVEYAPPRHCSSGTQLGREHQERCLRCRRVLCEEEILRGHECPNLECELCRDHVPWLSTCPLCNVLMCTVCEGNHNCQPQPRRS